MLEESAPWYPKEENAEKPTTQSREKGSVPTIAHAKVDKIIENVMNHTKTNILMGQLLEIAPIARSK
jgi:hypothetical protein